MRAATINIPRPCAESWDTMTPTAAGRHCAACQKPVVDFTRMTNAEILSYLAHSGQDNSCGRFKPGQLNQSTRLLTWRAAPRLAASVAAILILAHCTPDNSIRPPAKTEQSAIVVQKARLVHGRVLDRDTRRPLAGALIICEADTLCQTRTAANGSFTLAVPPKLASSKLIAAVMERLHQPQGDEDWLMPYIPHYFTADNDVTVLLRRPPMIVGQTKLESGETYTPAIAHYLVQCEALPPPLPKLTTIEFTPPKKRRH